MITAASMEPCRSSNHRMLSGIAIGAAFSRRVFVALLAVRYSGSVLAWRSRLRLRSC
ncbi:MAG TPA: hypothetical protein VNA69_17400 [Thermoanaerobaculia bacterium]|nr:hypothetical protein [Thermoanaerobaculia bacterium]